MFHSLIDKFRLPNQPRHLNNKMFAIHVTNVCNLSCGGCDQFCGYFHKDKLWFISLEELERHITSFRDYLKENWNRSDFPEEDKVVLLYGGEPTVHPKFEEILQILHSHHDIPFAIYTNGRSFESELAHIDLSRPSRDVSREVYKTTSLPKSGDSRFERVFRRFHAHNKNVAFRIDLKTTESKGCFVATGCAPCDMEPQGHSVSKLDYWKRAQKHCYKWRQCENAIYNGKAYVCNVAASMDWMFSEGAHGWEVKPNENPFNKSPAEIEKQMQNFCYRCGYNSANGLNGFEARAQTRQFIQDGTMITATNSALLDQRTPKSKLLRVIEPAREFVPEEVFR